MRAILSAILFCLPLGGLFSVPSSGGTEVFLHDFSVSLYLNPDKNSEVLKILPYGYPIREDVVPLVDGNSTWIPIVDREGVAGYVFRSQVTVLPVRNRYKFVSRDIENKMSLHKTAPHRVDLWELAGFLLYTVQEGTYSGDDFLSLKIRGGEILAMALREQKEFRALPERYAEFLVADAGGFRVSEDFFWFYAKQYPKSRWGEYSASQAVRFTPRPECKGDPACFLRLANRTYLEYLALYPRGKNAGRFTKEWVEALEYLTRDREHIACFPPLPVGDYKTLKETKDRVSVLSNQNHLRSRAQKALVRLESECFPRYPYTE